MTNPHKDPELHMDSDDIAKVLGLAPATFTSQRTRKRLRSKGMPASISRGLWLKAPMQRWLDRLGSMPSLPRAPKTDRNDQ